ncbi:MAG TPA: DUF5666 domain-containing protein [Longimicrobiales bacterium]|nr:DUF5666 domain-containing protein [Longimicrobiales bacterium]
MGNSLATIRRRALLGVTGVLLFAAPACASLDILDDVIQANGNSSVLTGEVRSVDTRRGRLDVRDNYSNRTRTVRFDSRTRITNGTRQYPASSLRRGDQVRVHLSRDRSGTMWANRVEVRNTSRDGRVVNARVQRLEGRVLQVDSRRGLFTVEPSRNRTVVVYVPRNVSSNDARRLNRLRRGDRVRMDVRQVSGNAVELVRFR